MLNVSNVAKPKEFCVGIVLNSKGSVLPCGTNPHFLFLLSFVPPSSGRIVPSVVQGRRELGTIIIEESPVAVRALTESPR